MLISYVNNIGQCNWNPALWVLTKGKPCCAAAWLQVMNIQGSREEHLLIPVTPVAIVACWQPL